jgi:hypothetical protein
MGSVGYQNTGFWVLAQAILGVVRGIGDTPARAKGSVGPEPRQVILSVSIAIEFDCVDIHQNLVVSE